MECLWSLQVLGSRPAGLGRLQRPLPGSSPPISGEWLLIFSGHSSVVSFLAKTSSNPSAGWSLPLGLILVDQAVSFSAHWQNWEGWDGK